MDALKVEGALREDGIPNVFNVFQLDRDKRKESQEGWGSQTQAVFASAEIGYKSTYYLTLTGRNDWESALANTKSPSFFYPSVGLSTILSEIISMPKQINYMKVRGSFASVGTPIPRNISIPTHAWDNDKGVWNTSAIYPIRVFKPERTTSWEVGLTTRFLDHFNLDVSWYYTNTTNQTFQPQISVSSGYSTIYMQTGNVRNTGLESGLRYTNSWRDFNWTSNLVFSFNRNKIKELVKNAVHPETGEIINKDRLNIGGHGRASFILKTGGTLGDLYSTQDLRYDSNGNIYTDISGNLQNVNSDDIYLGSVLPKYNTSWRNDFSWKNFNLGFMISARVGGVVYSATQAALDFYGASENTAIARDNGGVLINGGDLIPAEIWYNAIGASDGLPQYYTYSATNVRLQELSFGYTFPKKMLKFGDVTLSAVGRNLWMIYNKAPFDPEAVATTGNYFQGIDHFMVPSLRNVGFNLRVKF
jgi:outer membrane receptor protein involved in Fe transport